MASSTTRRAVAVAVAYGAQAAALTILLVVSSARTPLPVIATFRADARTVIAPIASVDLGWALVAVLAGGAVTFAGVAVAEAADAGAGTTDAAFRRSRAVVVGGWSQGSAILVFLVAQFNGIAEVASLVPLYAITATAAVLLGIDDVGDASTWRRPGAWAAAVGIVPWGVIAFAQIGTGIAVGEPPLGVRVVTLLALAVAVAGWVIGWRRPTSLRIVDLVVMTAGVSVVVWATVLSVVSGVRPG